MQPIVFENTMIDEIDSILPQTQCGLCGYGGCRPYAKAIAQNNEAIDRCPPGGIKTLLKLAQITGQNADSYLAEMAKKQKPAMLAVIREDECIGCVKCIQACPVDAIIGAAKQIHTIIRHECTGCELCIAPCPVDCIDMLPIPEMDDSQQQLKSAHAKQRYDARQTRLKKSHTIQKDTQQKKPEHQTPSLNQSLAARKSAIFAAISRVKVRKKQAESC